ncbi:MAG: glycosyltransferase [Blastochloris sp.]|nr:glycosyltransferase [Blastochloris sp.]
MSNKNTFTTQEVSQIKYRASQSGLVIIIPAYNRAQDIGTIVNQARIYTPHVIVVDDASEDATTDQAYQAGATVVQMQQHRGYREAVASALGKAREYTPDILVVLPASSQDIASQLVQVLQPMHNNAADIVVDLASSHEHPHPLVAFSARAFQMLSFCADSFATEADIRSLAEEYSLSLIGVSCHTPPSRPSRPRRAYALPHFNQPYRPVFLFGSVGGMLVLLAGFTSTWGLHIPQSINIFSAQYSLIHILLILTSICLISLGFMLHLTRNTMVAEHMRSTNDA